MKDQNHFIDILNDTTVSRRKFVTGITASSLMFGLTPTLSLGAPPLSSAPQELKGKSFDLKIGYQTVNFTGKNRIATGVNGSIPCPTLRWKEGERITLRVTNHLAHDSSIHWHGIILPTNMDGVPGLSFQGIKPGETYKYQFDVNQSGTYWYHSHSGFQEATGVYGAIIIEPKEQDPVAYDREHVVVLSDWSDDAPELIYAKLKKMSDYYNFRERTIVETWRDIKSKGLAQTLDDRAMWNQMRMMDTDISDVNAHTYTYLMNGVTPTGGWTGLFKKGEKVRLRIINASAMTIFDLRIPGLKLTVVTSDGQNIEPVTVDEFRIGVAETYDVIVEPEADNAYCIFAQSIDRTGFVRGNLTSDVNLVAQVPSMDEAPRLQHRDMGMSMAMGMDHSAHSMSDMKGMDMKKMDHSMSGMQMASSAKMTGDQLGKAGFGSLREIKHLPTEFGPEVDMRAESPLDGLNDPGIGLREHKRLHNRKVLHYGDIFNLNPTLDPREPTREIQLHLTGNMHRYMWSINGVKFADADPIQLKFGERVRFVLINDTMMTHPIHLHGVWSELETGNAKYIPRKHTVLVQPGSKISYLVTADAAGRWAYHCHLLFHMPGMFREIRIS
jgi:CopA family copper-resistance protein